MKRISALVFSLLPFLGFAVNATAKTYPMAGCGLAYILFSEKDNSSGIQILAGTTNNIYGTQSFGITSGTSGCTDGGLVKASREAEAFAEVNFQQLQSEIASGNGEYLNNLAALLNVKEDQRSAFFQLARVRYTEIFPSPESGSTELLNGLLQALADHPELIG